jgi:negative regulator of sigma E activity
MKSHLTEDILIQYQFDLLDDTQRSEASAHLEECGQCREAFAALQQRFSVLNVLNNEEVISDELIQKTIASIHQPKALRPGTRRSWMGWMGWMAIAASVILAAGVIFVGQPYWNAPTEKIQDKSLALGVKAPMEPAASENKPAHVEAPAAAAVAQADKMRIVPQDQIPDKPPFAPASAIELVVLPSPDKMQVTIYNDADLTLVRDTRKLTLKAGWNWLQFMWNETRIDPTSLSLRPLEQADKIDVQQLVYPARLKDIGRWLIRSEVEGSVPFEITYFTSGLTWNALYQGTLSPDEKTMQLKGSVRVLNKSGQDYENTQTRLVIGKVHLLDNIAELAQQKPYGMPGMFMDENGLFSDGLWNADKDGNTDQSGRTNLALYSNRAGGVGGAMRVKAIAKEGLSEYFLYTIEGTEDLKDQWAKRLPSFDVNDIPVKGLYKYDEDRYGDQTVRFISFVNDPNHKLGAVPMPQGKVTLYRQLNDQQNLSYVGGADIKYIPVNEDVELNLGTNSLVSVKAVLMDARTDNYMFNDKGDIAGWDEIETWQIKLTNTRDIPADFEVTRNFNTDSWDLKRIDTADVDYKKHDARHARFTTSLQPRTEKLFQYTVTKYCGTRKEAKLKQSQ